MFVCFLFFVFVLFECVLCNIIVLSIYNKFIITVDVLNSI